MRLLNIIGRAAIGKLLSSLLTLAVYPGLITFLMAGACGAPALPLVPPQTEYQLQEALGGLRFDQPVGFFSAPGETNRLFVVERTGRIMVVTNLMSPSKSVFLDVTTNLLTISLEDGLLGAAFHPKFRENGYFYVYRTITATNELGFYDQLSRFEVSPDNPNVALRESETPILFQPDASAHHNGGSIRFGPDGYLYLAIGDIGDDPHAHASTEQVIDKSFFGGILRIDVDKKPGNLPPNDHPGATPHYLIPADNPFIGLTTFLARPVAPQKVRTEFFAIGLRNPWGLAFHPDTGDLYAADVGQDKFEEINTIVKGGNYGWPYIEGETPLADPLPSGLSPIEPSIHYAHGNGELKGNCVIGGEFYEGAKIPELTGNLIFGDFAKGHIWAANHTSRGLSSSYRRLTGMIQLSTFGVDPSDREILLANFASGKIYKLTKPSAPQSPPFPKLLSEVGAFADLRALTPIPEFKAYEVNHPFWSDGAAKQRWYRLPPGGKIDYSETNNWAFPPGTIWMKHFEIELKKGESSSKKRLETRFLVKQQTGVYGVTYKWRDDDSDAELVKEEGEDKLLTIHDGEFTRSQLWHFPGRTECLACHTEPAGHALAFNTLQLNKRLGSDEEQIQKLAEDGVFASPPQLHGKIPRLTSVNDSEAALHTKVRSYLAANCSFCHQPETLKNYSDFRFFSHTVPGVSSTFPQLYERLTASDGMRMPPLASNVHDTNAIELVRRWLVGWPQPPWTISEVGVVPSEGFASFQPQFVEISGGGHGLQGAREDSLGFLHLPGRNFTALSVEYTFSEGAEIRAGLSLRSSLEPMAAAAMVDLGGDGSVSASIREVSSATAENLPAVLAPGGRRLRFHNRGGMVQFQFSADGSNWKMAGEKHFPPSGSLLAGMTARGPAGSKGFAKASNFKLVSIGWAGAGRRMESEAGQTLELGLLLDTYQTEAQVELYQNGVKLPNPASPQKISWSALNPGRYVLTARAVDATGMIAATDPLEILVKAPALAAQVNQRIVAGHSWQSVYGSQGFSLPGITNKVTPEAAYTPPTHQVLAFEQYLEDSRALLRPGGSGRTSSVWAGTELEFSFQLEGESIHRLAFYFCDWLREGRQLKITALKADSGTTLGEAVIENFGEGIFSEWAVRGSVRFVITSLDSKGVQVAGLFLDPFPPLNPPSIRVVRPRESSVLRLPGPFSLSAEVVPGSIPVARVEYFVDGLRAAAATTAPFVAEWAAPQAGTHQVRARVIDLAAGFVDSAPVTVVVTAARSLGAFQNSQAGAGVDWRKQFGDQGFLIPAGETNLPGPAGLRLEGHSTGVWNWPSQDERSLFVPRLASRMASSLYSQTGFRLEYENPTGSAQQLTLYFLDWDRLGWSFRVTVRDEEGEVLDQRTVSQFQEGIFMSWMVRGKLVFEFSDVIGFAVVSGIFVDNLNDPPAVHLVVPTDGAEFTAPQSVLLKAAVSGERQPVKVEFFSGSQLLGKASNEPYNLRWYGPVVGVHEITASLSDDRGLVAEAESVQVKILDDRPGAALLFGEDRTTKGNWREVYGEEGWAIAGIGTNLPPWASLRLENPSAKIHERFPTSGSARALVHPSTNERIASAWSSPNDWSLVLELNDTWWRKVALCFLDWERTGVDQSVTVSDLKTGEILATKRLSNFSDPTYLQFHVRGSVKMTFHAFVGKPVLSALFLDRLDQYQNWRHERFGSLLSTEPGMTNDGADPDGDGLVNLVEYRRGSDPLTKNTVQEDEYFVEDGFFHLVRKRTPGTDTLVQAIEYSHDLAHWTPIAPASREVHPAQDYEEIKSRFRLPSISSNFFLRVLVAPPGEHH